MQELRNKFINLVAKKGWYLESMRAAAVELGLDPDYHLVLFPGGISETLDAYERLMDDKMLDSLSAIESPPKIRQKIALALNLAYCGCHMALCWRRGY